VKKSRRRVVVVVLVALGLVFGLAGYLVVSTLGSGQFVTELPFEKPESLVFYERLAEYVARADGSPSDTVDPELERAVESLDRWKALLDLARSRLKDTAAGEAIYELVSLDAAEWEDADGLEAEALIAANNDLIEKTRDAVLLGGPIQLLPGTPNVQPWGPNVGLLRELVRLTCLRVKFNATQGDQSEAVSDAVLGMELVNLIAGEPHLTSQLVYYPLYESVALTLRDAFPPGEMDLRELDRLLTHTALAYHRETFADALRADAFSEWRGLTGQTTRSAVPLQQTYSKWKVRKEQANHVEVAIPLAELAEQPYYEIAPKLGEATGTSSMVIDSLLLSLDSRYFSKQLWRALVASCFRLQAQHEATVDLFRMGLLIEQHYAEHGSYPDSLDVLAPALGGTVPLDPFSGEPYRYVVNDDGFLLYSVGENQVDDGGVHDHVIGDWVWRGE